MQLELRKWEEAGEAGQAETARGLVSDVRNESLIQKERKMFKGCTQGGDGSDLQFSEITLAVVGEMV